MKRLRTIRPQKLWVWLLDDWQQAMERSLLDSVPPDYADALRVQRHCGQAAKVGLLFLPLLILISFLIQGTTALRWIIAAWAFAMSAALLLHIAVGARHNASFGWAFHHTHPLLLTGAAANHDLRIKSLLAVGFGVFFMTTMLIR